MRTIEYASAFKRDFRRVKAAPRYRACINTLRAIGIEQYSRWGRGERQVWSVNMSRMTGQLIDQLKADLRAREAEMARLLRLSDFGCANQPLYRLVRSA